MGEQYYENLLNIKTSGVGNHFYDSYHYHRYEPTSYIALKALAEQYQFAENDNVVDFGCGKGRVPFFINYFFNASVTGVEMNSLYYDIAVKNKDSYTAADKRKKGRVHFVNCLAESYKITPSDNKFYFFNPFSVQVFAKVVKNILVSKEEHDRTIDIILYYPSAEYIYYLNTNTPFLLQQEVDIEGLSDKDPRDAFLIFRVEAYRHYNLASS
jgi:SAM-dependent methyltransferase